MATATRLIPSAVVAGASAVSLAYAADYAPAPIVAERELLLFDEPVVSAASKHSQPANEAPSAVTIITREEIRRFGYRTLAEALRSVRGFYTTSDRAYTFLGVRGFLRPGDYNDRILLLVNGHTYNDDIYQTAYVGNEFGIDIEAVQRIEVIPGPGSALYGGNALFAVINVVTSTGADQPGIHAGAEIGSFGRKRAQMNVGHTFANGLDVFASGSVLDLDGNQDLFYPEFDDPSTNDGIAHHADAERVYNLFMSARWGRLTMQGGVNYRLKHIPTAPYGTTFDDNDTKTSDTHPFFEVGYGHTLLPDLDVNVRAYYDSWRYHGTYVYSDGTDRTKNQDFARSHWYGSEVRARWTGVSWNVLTVGAEYSYHPDAHQENFDQGGARFLDDHRSFDIFGVYAQSEITPMDGLTLVTGVRFDHDYDRISEVSPRAAVIWRARPATTVKLLFGQAFRPPNIFEQYYTLEGEPPPPGSSLKPERIHTYEAVLEQKLWRDALGTVSLYHYDVDDLIDSVPTVDDEGTETFQFRNTSQVRANGAEVELRAQLPRGATMRASYAIQEARTKEGRLSNSPRHLGYLGVLLPIVAGLAAAAELNVVGPRTTRDGRNLETARIANVNLVYRSPIRNLDVAAGLYNILDQTVSRSPPAVNCRTAYPRTDSRTACSSTMRSSRVARSFLALSLTFAAAVVDPAASARPAIAIVKSSSLAQFDSALNAAIARLETDALQPEDLDLRSRGRPGERPAGPRQGPRDRARVDHCRRLTRDDRHLARRVLRTDRVLDGPVPRAERLRPRSRSYDRSVTRHSGRRPVSVSEAPAAGRETRGRAASPRRDRRHRPRR